MNKLGPVLIAIIILLLLPLVFAFRAKPLDSERIIEAFREDGLSVQEVRSVTPPQFQAVSHLQMTVNGSRTNLFLFKDENARENCIKFFELMSERDVKNDTAAIGSGLGPPVTVSARNGDYLLVIRSRNKQLRARATYLFESL